MQDAKKFFTLMLPVFLFSLSFNTFASASYLYNMYGAIAVGDGGAGGAALAADATTLYANPAGMVRLPQQFIIAATEIVTTVKFSGTNTWSSPGFASYTQSGKAKGGASALLPEFYYVYPMANQWSWGLSATAPAGLGTYYSPESVLRYSATMSELKILDISPNLAYQINSHWSLGGGVDFDYFRIRLRAMAGLPAVNPGLDSLSSNQADGWGYGGHGGILYQLSDATRFGLAYRSKVRGNLTGKSKLEGGVVNLLTGGLTSYTANHSLTTSYTLPPVTTFSAYQDLNSQWAIDGSVNYLQWSQLAKNLTVNNLALLPAPVTASLPQDYRNSWILAGGAIYKPTDSWLLRSGIFWDQTPITANNKRTVNLPDNNRLGLAIGGHYQLYKNIGLDAGYTHIFLPQSQVNTTITIATQSSTAQGKFNNQLDVFAAQLSWDIV